MIGASTAAGQGRRLAAVAVWVVAACAPPLGAGELKVGFQLGVETARAQPFSAILRASAEATGEQPVLAIEKVVEVPGETTLDLAAGRVWRLALESEELWMPGEVALGSAEMKSTSLKAWPLGQVVGEIAFPEDEKTPPELLEALVSAAPQKDGSQAFARAVFRCPISADRWSCKLPVGDVDLKLKAKGFLPHYFWNLAVLVGKPVALGKLALRRGSAVSGYVEIDGKPEAGTKTSVELGPLETAPRRPDETAALAQRQGLRKELQEPNPRGFFFFPDVVPGAYEIVARHDGFADAHTGAFTLPKNVEMELTKPLILAPPFSLELLIEPEVDPWGNPWVVHLSRVGASPRPELVAQKPAEVSGLWQKDELSPGKYVFGLTTKDKGGFWHSAEVDLSKGSQVIQVKIPVLHVRGEVFLGDEPLEAELNFYTKSTTFRFQSDPEGKFEGLMTEPGDWKVIVFAPAKQLMKRLSRVRVDVSEGASEAEIKIKLADNRLIGKVVDEQGKPVRATVMAFGFSGDGSRSVGTDAEGEFELHGLEQGEFLVSAFIPDGPASEEIRITIEDKIVPAPLELVVREMLLTKGRVVFDGLGIPEAEILLLPLQAPLASTMPNKTDVEGEFKAKLAKGTSHAAVTVQARGFALRMLTVPVEQGRKLEISLSQVSGSLLLKFAEPPDGDYRSGVTYGLLRNGSWTILQALVDWARVNGGQGWVDPLSLSVPNLEPGEYSVCVVKTTDLLPTLLGARPADRCVSGVISPFGELVLEVPAPPKLE